MTTGADGRTPILIYSFGFKHGYPIDANILWDVRFLPNPYWQEDLRPFCGLDRQVAAYVADSSAGREFLSLVLPLVRFYAAADWGADGRSLRIAIGCTGGRHRSVAVVETVRHRLAEEGIAVQVFHRDLDREPPRT